jgi:hypothetical protein
MWGGIPVIRKIDAQKYEQENARLPALPAGKEVLSESARFLADEFHFLQ